MLLTGTDTPQPSALSWPFLTVGKYFKNIFDSVASIYVKYVIMFYCGDRASVGLSCDLLVRFDGVKGEL